MMVAAIETLRQYGAGSDLVVRDVVALGVIVVGVADLVLMIMM